MRYEIKESGVYLYLSPGRESTPRLRPYQGRVLPLNHLGMCWEQDSNLRSPFGRRFYRPLQLTTLPSQPFDILRVNWSREWDSNPRPIVYKTIALPLSYLGVQSILLQIPAIGQLLFAKA